jgi:protein-tyrosine kinase
MTTSMNLTLASNAPKHHSAPESADDAANQVDQSIGEVLRKSKGLSNAQVEQILAHQRTHQMRFGEAAVALKLATADDVLWALSKQFHYAYAARQGLERSPELVAALDPFGEQAEAFRDLRSQLLADALASDGQRRALAVVSPDPGDGKTFFTANLAVVMSQLGGRTLLIDANLRTPRQRELFGIDNGAGLSGILLGRETAQVVYQAPDMPCLYVLPSGTIPPNPLELLQRPSFGALLRDLLDKFDHVIVDTPAAAHGADAKVIAAQCGSAIAIGRSGKSTMKSLEKLSASLDKGPIKFLGMVMNEH